MSSGGPHDGHDVRLDVFGDMGSFRGPHQVMERGIVRNAVDRGDGDVRGSENALLSRFGRVSKGEPKEKAIQLGLGEGVDSPGLDGILSGEDEEGWPERKRSPIEGHLLFRHGLQECGLGAWRRPVDFIGQDDLRVDGTWMKSEAARLEVGHMTANDVGGEKVRCELDAFEIQTD